MTQRIEERKRKQTNKKAAASSQSYNLLTGLLQVNTPPYTTGYSHVPHVLILHDFCQLNKAFYADRKRAQCKAFSNQDKIGISGLFFEAVYGYLQQPCMAFLFVKFTEDDGESLLSPENPQTEHR